MSGPPKTTKGVSHYRIAQRNVGKLAPLKLGNKIPIPPSQIPRQPIPPPRPPPNHIVQIFRELRDPLTSLFEKDHNLHLVDMK